MRNTTLMTPDGQRLELDYFVHWRTYLWRKPVRNMLAFLGSLPGKQLLLIGDTPGRLTSFFALMGAHVTLADPNPVDTAEFEKWGVRDKVSIVPTSGMLAELGEARFEMAVTKSVLWGVPNLESFLREIGQHLHPGAKVVFLENTYGSAPMAWLRRHLNKLYREREKIRFGVKASQLPLFRQQFDQVSIRTHFGMVYEIKGHARQAAPRPGTRSIQHREP